jgi:membrane-associated protease RseP (regulator of RpoE activity)
MRCCRPFSLACLVLTLVAADGYQDGDGTAGLGALTGPVPLAVQAQTGLAPGEGTMVRRVIPWAPAGEIGLQPGDVIVAIDGVPIDSRRDLRQEVWSNRPGDAFELTVLRGSAQPLTLSGTYGRLPDWLETRLRLPGEGWEDRVEARQRELLAAIARELSAGEALAAASRAEREAAQQAGSPPLVIEDADRRPVLGLAPAASAWSFRFHWQHEAVAPREVEL